MLYECSFLLFVSSILNIGTKFYFGFGYKSNYRDIREYINDLSFPFHRPRLKLRLKILSPNSN